LQEQTTRVGANGKTYQAPRPKHWAENKASQHLFWGRANRNQLDPETILGKLQKGAKTLTDLKCTLQEAEHRLNQIAIDEHSARWKRGDYVRHVTGRYGRVNGCTPDYLDVLDLKIDVQNAWRYQDCQPATREEWQQAFSQFQMIDLPLEFGYLQEVVVWTQAAIQTTTPQGVYEPTMRTMPAGTRVQYVQSFQQNGHLYVEVNWSGSPAVLPQGSLRAIEAPAPEPDVLQVESEAHFYSSTWAPVDDEQLEDEPANEESPIPNLPLRQVEFLLALSAGEPVVRNAATRMALRGHGLITNDDDWDAIRLTDDGERVADFYSEDEPDDSQIDFTSISLADFESDALVEIVPALARVLAYCEGYDVKLDDEFERDAWALLRFFDQVTEMVAEHSQRKTTA
jgi:hypothetical protein